MHDFGRVIYHKFTALGVPSAGFPEVYENVFRNFSATWLSPHSYHSYTRLPMQDFSEPAHGPLNALTLPV